jgi:hypothetical protein
MSPDRHGGEFFNDVVAPIKRMTLIQGAGVFCGIHAATTVREADYSANVGSHSIVDE